MLFVTHVACCMLQEEHLHKARHSTLIVGMYMLMPNDVLAVLLIVVTNMDIFIFGYHLDGKIGTF